MELYFRSKLGLRFKSFLMVAVLEIFDGAARWSSHEPELVAVVDPGNSSTTGKATFPFPLGPMERKDASD